MDRGQLKARFVRDATALGCMQHAENICGRLFAAYDEPHRAYHTMAHIEHGLGLIDELRDSLSNRAEVAIAYWFHDAVYAQGPFASNEADSARMAMDACAEMGIGSKVAARLRTMILATKTHTIPEGTIAGADADLETLLDVDLSILAADAYTFACFERDVRKEYTWVPERLFAHGRRRALGAFLLRPSVYKRAHLRDRWEPSAQANLKRLILTLDQPQTAPVIDATDACIFSTNKGRLIEAHPWSDMMGITAGFLPDDLGVELVVSFGVHSPTNFHVPLHAAAFANAVNHLRAVPGYNPQAEVAAAATHQMQIGFMAARNGTITGPVMPGSAIDSAIPYR